MATQTDIVNKALIELGENPISSIDENVKAAILAKASWRTDLESVLSEHDWTFARVWVALAQETDVDSPDDGFEYIYRLPANFIRFSNQIPSVPDKYSVYGNYILSNIEDLEIRFIRYTEDTNLFPAYFVDALASKICGTLSVPLSGKASKKIDWGQRYRDYELPKAISKDAAKEVGRAYKSDDTWVSLAQSGG